jgi:hypothetical protein
MAKWKKVSRDRLLGWLHENGRLKRPGTVVADTAQAIDKRIDRVDGFQVSVGSQLLRSGRPAILAIRRGDFFSFELSPAQAAALGLKKSHCRIQPYFKGDEACRVRPSVYLSGLHIDHADALPRHQRIRGTVSYEGLRSPGEMPHVRMTIYPVPLKKRRIGLFYLHKTPLPASGRVAFDFGELGDARVQKGPLVLFIELACWRGGREVIESNTLAVLVTPLDETPGSGDQ